MADRNDDAIAIVGIGCKVPGADNIRDLWRVLLGAENHVLDIPLSRWNARAYYDPDPMTPGKAYVTKAGLVSEPEEFDHKIFGISEMEAATMDPQQRFVLDCTLMAMEDAGWTRRRLAGSNTGVFIGVSNSDYRALFKATSSNVDNYTVTGISNSIIAARVSYVFDLRGPSLVLDTACSSSLIGVHLACQAIRTGDCDMAIAGGTNYLTLPDVFVHLCKAGMMSASGQCHSFGSQADGYARGEGCGIVLLKRLSHAERDGDNIWATIYTGTNQDGRSVTPLIAPSGMQQQLLFESIYDKIGLNIDRIDYIEAHGTGTRAGDPVEANALGNFFQRCSSTRRRYVGSIKSNIGHLESAAGIVGVIKILLMMKYNTIAPSLHCEEPNPNISFDELMLTVPRNPVVWDTPMKVACCNSFGFGGSNCHAVLWQYLQGEDTSSSVLVSTHGRPCLVCVSAVTGSSLRGMMTEMRDDLGMAQLNVHDLSYTSTVRRDHYNLRRAWVVEDVSELPAVLQEEIDRPEAPADTHRKPKVTFVYCGMGTSWSGMCTELMDVLPAFRHTVLQVEEHLKLHVQWSLSERLQAGTHLDDPEFSPIAIFATQVALTAVWRDLGLEPHSIVGQSVGEVAAAHVAGCVSLQDAVKIVYHRSRLLASVTGGKMVVVRHLPVEQTSKVVTRYSGKACLSLQYSPTACCLSADGDIMKRLKEDLLRHHRGLQLIDLDVPVAYHSHHVKCCAAPLSEALQGLQTVPPTLPMLSSVTGRPLTSAPGVEYWVANLCCPVLFSQAVMQSREPKVKQVFLEIGPKPVLRAHLSDLFPKEDVPCLMSMSKPPEFRTLLQAVSELYVLGANFNWEHLPTLGTRVTDLPRFVFDKTNKLLKSEAAALALGGVEVGRLTHLYTFPLHDFSAFKLIISPLGLKSLYDHVLAGRVTIPGAFYVEAGFAMARHLQVFGNRQVVVSADFQHSMAVPLKGVLEIDVHLPDDVSISDRLKDPVTITKYNRVLATLCITKIETDETCSEVMNLHQVRSRCPEEVTKDFVYSALRNAGFMYGENFCLLDHAFANADECLATVKPTKTVEQEIPGTTIHPCILDCMLQSAIIIAAKTGREAKDLLPKAVGGVLVHRPMEEVMMVYSRVKERGSVQHVYDLKLLSPSGVVIAEVDGLVIHLTMETNKNYLPDMFNMEWSHVTRLPPRDGQTKGKRVLYLCDGLIAEDDGVSETQRVLSIPGVDFTHTLPASLQHTVTSALSTAEAVVLLAMVQPPDESADSGMLSQHITNVSFLYKELLQLAIQVSPSTTIFLCTCNAWPSPYAGHPDLLPVNPVATGVWGVCRTVVTERLYPHMVAMDLQLPLHQLTIPYVGRIVDLVMTHQQLCNHPELLVTPEGIHINLVTILDPDTPVPSFRSNGVKGDQPAILLSSESSALVRPFAVQHDITSASGKNGPDMTQIQALFYGLQNPYLFKMKMQYGHLSGPTQCHQAKGYTVFAVEAEGLTHLLTPSKGWVDARVAVCYPMAVATQVCVPTSVTLKTDLLPGYQMGDLSKLVVLWELCSKVMTPMVTLLTSRRSRHYGDALQAMLAGHKRFSVNVVLAEQLSSWNSHVHSTVVCLLRLDSDTMSCLISRWQTAVSFVTCCSLLDHEAMSLAYYFTPDLDVTLVNTQLLFQPRVLKARVSQVTKWVKGHAKMVQKVMAALHAHVPEAACHGGYSDGGVVMDLTDLLQMKRTEVTGLEVHVTKEQLFRQDCTYLVVGGLSGLGWLCVEYLAQKGAGHVAILNRRSPSQDQLNNIHDLMSRHACHVYTFQGDVTSVQSLNDVFQQMKVVIPTSQLKGVFFGAAVTADKSFFSMDVSTFQKALHPKVQGVWNLHQLTKDLDLNYFVMHSSIASVVGNGGQSNYAAGNAFMDGLAHYRRQRGLAAQSINWGPLDTGILGDNDVARRALEAQGFLFLSPQEIQEGLTPLLMLNWVQSSPVKVDKERLKQRVQREGNALFMARLTRVLNIRVQHAELDIPHELQAAKSYDPEKRWEVHMLYVRQVVASVLSVELENVTADVNLIDLGMDSIGAMTMINQIHRDLSRRLPAVAFLTGEPTVESIVLAIEETPEDGEESTEEAGVLVVTEMTEEDDTSVPTTVMEDHQLTLYRDNQDAAFHGVVDIRLKMLPMDEENVRRAILMVMDNQPGASRMFSFNPTSHKWYRRPSLKGQQGHDLRVIRGDGGSVWESVDRDTCEPFDVTCCGPVRYLLVLQSQPVLRVVFLKAVLDLPSAQVLAEQLKQCLESPGSVLSTAPQSEAQDTLEVQRLNQSIERVYREHLNDVLQYWKARLSGVAVTPSCLTLGSSSQILAGQGETKIGSLKLTVPPPLVSLLSNFISFHNLTLLGVVASCHQVLLHTYTGQETIVLLYHKNFRKFNSDISKDTLANCSSDIPLIANFSGDKITIQNFVLTNSQSISSDTEHGVLPLSMLQPLSETVSSLSGTCLHGINMEPLDQAGNEAGREKEKLFARKLKAKQALKIQTMEGTAAMMLGLQTNLRMEHRLKNECLTLSVSYKDALITKTNAEAILHMLAWILVHLLTRPDTSIRKLTCKGQKLIHSLSKR